MQSSIPEDIKAETLINYLSPAKCRLEFKGTHMRNVYQDILEIRAEDNGDYSVDVTKDSLYDILPEALFHPTDRFENITGSDYHERFAEEYEKQRIEEENAHTFFNPFDTALLRLGASAQRLKEEELASAGILVSIVADNLAERYKNNRFVKKALSFLPMCSSIRGNRSLITLLLRKILYDEGLAMTESVRPVCYADPRPRYNSEVDDDTALGADMYLGNEYVEDTMVFDVHFWDDACCGYDFMEFVGEIDIFADFVGDYFLGIGQSLRFDVSTDTLALRLSDDMRANYLNHNTNL